jgi:hypothetical protein
MTSKVKSNSAISVAKCTVSKSVAVKKSKKTVAHACDCHDPLPKQHGACDCHALPIGSIELVSMLLVLIFSLSAVLMTSVYALHIKSNELDVLQARVAQAQVVVE